MVESNQKITFNKSKLSKLPRVILFKFYFLLWIIESLENT